MSITVKLSEERKRLLSERSKVHKERLLIGTVRELRLKDYERSHPQDRKKLEDSVLSELCEALGNLDLQIDNYNEMLIDLRTLESLANINAINAQIAAQQQQTQTPDETPPHSDVRNLARRLSLIQDDLPPKDNAEQGVEFTEVVSDRPGYVKFEEVVPN